MNDVSPPKLIILSATAGYGHVKAGDDLLNCLLGKELPLEVCHLNIFDYTGFATRALMEKTWSVASITPFLRPFYSLAHKAAIGSDKFASFFMLLHHLAARRLNDQCEGSNVVGVVALHPSAVAAASVWKKGSNFRLFSVSTDLVVHSMQCFDEVDTIFADRNAVFASRNACKARAEGRIVFSGLPVGERHHSISREIRQRSNRILICFGAKGMRADRHIRLLLAVAKRSSSVEFHFVCGRNDALFANVSARVKSEGLNGKVIVHGFVEDMAEMVANSCMIIGKPGGISVGEALAQRKPFVILDLLPGQEEYNQQVLIRAGLGVLAQKEDEILDIIGGVLNGEFPAPICVLPSAVPLGIEGIASCILQNIDCVEETTSAIA